MASKLESPIRLAKEVGASGAEIRGNLAKVAETENMRMELGNIEMRLKGFAYQKDNPRVVSEDEKRMLGENLMKLKDELLRQREQNLQKDRESFDKQARYDTGYDPRGRINELEKEVEKTRQERDRLARTCTELKTELNTLQNKLIRQGGETDLAGYRARILELEGRVRELSEQLERWGGAKPRSALTVRSPTRPQQTRLVPVVAPMEEDKLQIEGVNAEIPGRPAGAFVPSAYNTGRQTLSQQRVAQKIKKEIAKKNKPRVRNYNYRDQQQA